MNGWRRRNVLALLGAAAVVDDARASARAAGPVEAALADVERMRVQAQAPAAGISVVHGGAVVATRGLGLASIPFQAPAQATTLFHLGSVSKQLTAALVLDLAEAGALRLDDPVGQHARGLPDAFAGVPVRALLSHTGGVADYEGLPGFEPDRRLDRAAFLKGAATLPLDFKPGDAWAYSNTGYVLLGYMLADITGRSYRDLLTKRLLRGAGLPHARVDDASAIIPGRAEPYVMADEEVRHAVGMDGDFSGWPDGGVLMSAADAARWELALQNGPKPSRLTLAGLTRPTLMSTGRSAAYGAGWFTDQVAGHAVQYHSGSVPGFLTFAWRAPTTRTAVTVMINIESGPGARFMREACLTLAEAVAPGSTPVSLSPIRDDAPEITARTLKLFARGDAPLARDWFAPEIANLMDGRARSALPPNYGTDVAGLSWTLVERFAEPGGHVRRYRATRGNASRYVSVAHDPSGRIFRVRTI